MAAKDFWPLASGAQSSDDARINEGARPRRRPPNQLRESNKRRLEDEANADVDMMERSKSS